MSVIVFEELTVSNFLSFGQKPTKFKLNRGMSVAIRGKNCDVNDNSSSNESGNGAGKTVSMNAIVFALFGKGIDKIKSDEFINLVNGKKMVVELIFSKGSSRYKIRRGRKPNIVELYQEDESGWQSYTLDAMRNTDTAIEELIGYTYDNFMASVFLSPHRQSFLAMGAADQRSMIETMLSLDTFAARAETLKTMRDDVRSELKLLEKDLERAEHTNEQLELDIARFKQLSKKFDEDKQKELERLSKTKEELDRIDPVECRKILDELDQKKSELKEFQSEHLAFIERLREYEASKRKLDDLTKKYHQAVGKRDLINKQRSDSLTEALEVLNEYNLDELEQKREAVINYQRDVGVLNGLKESKRNEEFRLSTLRETLDSLELELEAHADGKCHVCGGDYVDEAKHSTLKDKIESYKKSIVESSEKLRSLNESIKSTQIDTTLENLNRQEIDAIISVVKDAQRLVDAPFVNEMDATIKFLNEEIDSLGNSVVDPVDEADGSEIEQKINSTKTHTQGLESILSEQGIMNQRELDTAMAQKAVIEQQIEECLKRSNSFAEEVLTLGGRHVPVDPIKAAVGDSRKRETHIGYLIKLMTDSKSFVRKKILENYIPFLNKKINEYSERLGLSHVCMISNDLTVEILYMNRPVSYFLMSRGERMRLDMSLTRAFRDMMGLLGKGCNIVLVDEALDSSLDIAGAAAAAKFLKECSDDVFVITHRDDITEAMDMKITMVKNNGFTTVDYG